MLAAGIGPSARRRKGRGRARAEEVELIKKLMVNGVEHELDLEPDTPLLWVIRDTLNLTGTKFGCGAGLCGACTALIGGNPTRTCQLTLRDYDGSPIVTIEGLSKDRSHPVQVAWLAEQVPQCGYCQSGMI